MLGPRHDGSISNQCTRKLHLDPREVAAQSTSDLPLTIRPSLARQPQ